MDRLSEIPVAVAAIVPPVEIKTVLNNAEFHNRPVDEDAEDGLGHRAKALIDRVTDLAERDDHEER